MAQPEYVPVPQRATVRPSSRLATARRWAKGRPGELSGTGQPGGRGLGVPGPDQGYAMALARRFEDRLVLSDHEQAADVTEGVALLASRRAASFGRAPSVYDVQVVLNLFCFLEPAHPDLVALRSRLFGGASHGFEHRAHLADAVPNELLAELTPTSSAADDGLWRRLLG